MTKLSELCELQDKIDSGAISGPQAVIEMIKASPMPTKEIVKKTKPESQTMFDFLMESNTKRI